MTTRDGTRLDADVWRPDRPGLFPMLLLRQPYGRRIASTLVYAHPGWYAAQGYIVVIQDVRGTWSSEGRFRLFVDEEADGVEAVRWATSLPGASGRMGMYGFSYQAVTQFLALAGGAEVHAMAPTMAGWDMRSDWVWEGGAFAFAAGLGWGAQMGWIKACNDGEAQAAADFQAMARALPLQTADRAMPAAMQRHARLSHYADWIAHPEAGPYWDAFAPRARLAGMAVKVPMLHIGGWYDQMLMGTLDSHQALSDDVAPDHARVVGPWTHQPWGRRVGAVDFGAAASSPIDGMQIAFFDRHLKGIGDLPPPLRLFDLGMRAWTTATSWPALETSSWYLGGTGLACATTTDGTLRQDLAPEGTERLVHDPWRAVPSHGGHYAQPGGMQDRADAACFTTIPLAEALPICGRVAAELWVTADQSSFDVSAVLAMVDPQGRSWNLTQGHARFDGPSAGPCRVAMRATMTTVPAGHALRLSLAATNFPAFPVNPGTGATPLATRAEEEQVIVMTLLHGGATPSRLLLPINVEGRG